MKLTEFPPKTNYLPIAAFILMLLSIWGTEFPCQAMHPYYENGICIGMVSDSITGKLCQSNNTEIDITISLVYCKIGKLQALGVVFYPDTSVACRTIDDIWEIARKERSKDETTRQNSRSLPLDLQIITEEQSYFLHANDKYIYGYNMFASLFDMSSEGMLPCLLIYGLSFKEFTNQNINIFLKQNITNINLYANKTHTNLSLSPYNTAAIFTNLRQSFRKRKSL